MNKVPIPHFGNDYIPRIRTNIWLYIKDLVYRKVFNGTKNSIRVNMYLEL